MLRALALIMLTAGSPGTAGPDYIEISPAVPASGNSFPGWRVEAPFPARVEMHVDLGDTIEGQTLAVGGASEGGDEYRAQIQYETSVTIMNEGPHLDLVDWKHYTSPWENIPAVSQYRFRLPVLTEMQTTMFPEVTVREIQEAVLVAGGERWAKLVRHIAGPWEYPAGVGLSRIRVRIQRSVNMDWQTLTTLVVITPMGC